MFTIVRSGQLQTLGLLKPNRVKHFSVSFVDSLIVDAAVLCDTVQFLNSNVLLYCCECGTSIVMVVFGCSCSKMYLLFFSYIWHFLVILSDIVIKRCLSLDLVNFAFHIA